MQRNVETMLINTVTYALTVQFSVTNSCELFTNILCHLFSFCFLSHSFSIVPTARTRLYVVRHFYFLLLCVQLFNCIGKLSDFYGQLRLILSHIKPQAWVGAQIVTITKCRRIGIVYQCLCARVCVCVCLWRKHSVALALKQQPKQQTNSNKSNKQTHRECRQRQCHASRAKRPRSSCNCSSSGTWRTASIRIYRQSDAPRKRDQCDRPRCVRIPLIWRRYPSTRRTPCRSQRTVAKCARYSIRWRRLPLPLHLPPSLSLSSFLLCMCACHEWISLLPLQRKLWWIINDDAVDLSPFAYSPSPQPFPQPRLPACICMFLHAQSRSIFMHAPLRLRTRPMPVGRAGRPYRIIRTSAAAQWTASHTFACLFMLVLCKLTKWRGGGKGAWKTNCYRISKMYRTQTG